MIRQTLTLAACLTLLSSVSAFAQSDAAFFSELSRISRTAGDGHYKLVERRAKAALDVLKDLHGYVMFAEAFPIARIAEPYVKYPPRARALSSSGEHQVRQTRHAQRNAHSWY